MDTQFNANKPNFCSRYVVAHCASLYYVLIEKNTERVNKLMHSNIMHLQLWDAASSFDYLSVFAVKTVICSSVSPTASTHTGFNGSKCQIIHIDGLIHCQQQQCLFYETYLIVPIKFMRPMFTTIHCIIKHILTIFIR